MKNKYQIKLASLLFMVLAVVSLILIVQAQTQEELRTELSELSSDLTDANYSWLVNYSGNIKIHNIMY